MDIYFKKDIGGRDKQQDNCNAFCNNFSQFLVLGDGMGGHSGGNLASQTLIKEAKKVYERYQNVMIDYPKEFFQEIIDNTQKHLKKLIVNNPKIDPHTTCVFALIQDEKLHVGHIGDSRMYLFVDKKFIKRSKDHSVVQILLNDGEITENEMATHPDQNKLLQSINAKKDVKITYKVEDFPKNLSNAVLICSDGFWEQISHKQMQEQIFSKPLNLAIDTMVKTAKLQAGSTGDNISVVVCKQNVNQTTNLKSSNKFMYYFISLFGVILLALSIFVLVKNQNKQTAQNISHNTELSTTVIENNRSNNHTNGDQR